MSKLDEIFLIESLVSYIDENILKVTERMIKQLNSAIIIYYINPFLKHP